MRYFLLLLLLIVGLDSARGQSNPDRGNIELATQYYTNRDFEKAAPLFRDLYQVSRNRSYFRLYLSCLTELERYQEAENDLRREIRSHREPQPDLLVHWGQLLKLMNSGEAAAEKYEEAIQSTPHNRSSFINTGNMFIQWREFQWAERLFRHGRTVVPGENFINELANVYSYMRNYSQMLEELLMLVRQNEANLSSVQSTLTSSLYFDVDNSLRTEFRTTVLRAIQAEPDVLAFNRLLIWFFIQERQFPAALRQSIALDRRTGSDEMQIMALAQMAVNNHHFGDAAAAYGYLLSKGRSHPIWLPAYINRLRASYQHYIRTEGENKVVGEALATQYLEAFDTLQQLTGRATLIKEYAHLLAFFLGKPRLAIETIEKELTQPGFRREEIAELKTELADIYVYDDDPYEAILLYSQVADAHRGDRLADEVNLKKARLSYYMGNFEWARGQLDVLKASTSKPTANDAMELALFITANNRGDSINPALQQFAQADFQFFRNQQALAMELLDSIQVQFPHHSIVENVLFRKAKIHLAIGNADSAIELLEEVAIRHRYGQLADDALFLLGETYLLQKNDTEKAAGSYRRILFEHPGSLYVPDARARFRELGGTDPRIPSQEEDPIELIFQRQLLP